jgi:hypothetical protein
MGPYGEWASGVVYQNVTKNGIFEGISGVVSETTEGVSQSKCNDISGFSARALGH